MSFTDQVKEEMVRWAPRGRQAAAAFLRGWLRARGTAVRRGGEVRAVLPLKDWVALRLARQLLKELSWPYTLFRRRDRRSPFVLMAWGPEWEAWWQEWWRALEEGRPWTDLPAPADRRQFVRGLFFGAGSLSGLGREPHWELHLEREDVAREAVAVLRELGFLPGFHRRRGAFVVYLKGTGPIGDMLRLLETPLALLAFEEERAQRELRSRVNRLVNADTANMGRALEAGLKDREAIRRLLAQGGWTMIPEAWRPLARLRLLRPEATLEELGRQLDPPLSRSAVKRRLYALRQRAEELEAGGRGGVP
ncbi:MAG: DNA-binding protein WhiA [Clostridiales bacterium]|nr:DNA-binding protein WhiA [Clostridiales bacterium]